MCGARRDGGLIMEAGWWVVVADSARARIFVATELPAPLREIEDLIQPEGRMSERTLLHDRPGRSFESVGGARHAISPHTSPRALSRHRFAERIAERIDRGLAEGSFRRLALVAPPAMLGALRAALSPPCKAHCELEIASDIGRMGRVDIERHLAHSATVARRPPAPGRDGHPHT
ncbi:MAG: host attachment protein [Betaproteobacteria bacterium]|nr:host attachment protein [Betaproteobacteria bacterium]